MNEHEDIGLQYCTFRLGDLYLGIDVIDVQEVLYHADVTWVPHAESAVRGLINLRGQIATTIDLRTRLGLESVADDIRQTHVVVRHAGEAISLLIDEVDDVLTVSTDQFAPPPATLNGPARDLIMGAYKLEKELLMVLDVRRALHVNHATNEGVNA